MRPVIKCTEVLIEDGDVVLSLENTAEPDWSQIRMFLPGEEMAPGACDGVTEVRIDKWVYVVDRVDNLMHTLYTTFSVERQEKEGPEAAEAHASSNNKIVDVKRIPLNCLKEYGFSRAFCEAALGIRR